MTSDAPSRGFGRRRRPADVPSTDDVTLLASRIVALEARVALLENAAEPAEAPVALVNVAEDAPLVATDEGSALTFEELPVGAPVAQDQAEADADDLEPDELGADELDDVTADELALDGALSPGVEDPALEEAESDEDALEQLEAEELEGGSEASEAEVLEELGEEADDEDVWAPSAGAADLEVLEDVADLEDALETDDAYETVPTDGGVPSAADRATEEDVLQEPAEHATAVRRGFGDALSRLRGA